MTQNRTKNTETKKLFHTRTHTPTSRNPADKIAQLEKHRINGSEPS